MADVKSFRISDETQEKIKEIAKNQPSMDDAFKIMLNAYEESQALTNSQNTAYLLNMKALCDNVYSSFRTVLESQAIAVAQVKEQDTAVIDKLQQEIDGLNVELKQAQERTEMANTALKTLQAEFSTLKELNEALKGKNEVLEQNIVLLNEKVQSVINKPIKKSVSKKPETVTVPDENK